jgi:hypothetical protein
MEQLSLIPVIPKSPIAGGRARRELVTRMADALLAVVGAGRPPNPTPRPATTPCGTEGRRDE